MARGWESKSVEMQMEERRQPQRKGPNNAADAAEMRELEVLKLSRKRVGEELNATLNPRLKQLKERALSHINEQIERLERGGRASGAD